VKSMKIDCGQNVRQFQCSDVELCQQFNFSAGNGRIYPQIPRDGYEIFLQHLHRDHTRLRAAMLGHQGNGAALFCGRSFVVRIQGER